MNSHKVFKTSLLAFACFGVLFGLLATLVINGVTDQFDQSVLLWINSHASTAVDTIFLFLTHLGGVYGVVAITALAVTLLIVKKKYDKALFVALAIGGVALLNTLLKTLFDRPRPDLWDWLVAETSFSFPSGHSVASATLALSIVLLLWNTRWRGVALAGGLIYFLVVGFSRMYLGVHYPSDVLGGWLLAFTWVALLVACFTAYKLRQSNRKALA
jgi:undecaprenyl-diphosphatase